MPTLRLPLAALAIVAQQHQKEASPLVIIQERKPPALAIFAIAEPQHGYPQASATQV
jgi:hypothetical protein